MKAIKTSSMHGEFDRDGFSRESFLQARKWAEEYVANYQGDHDQHAFKRHSNSHMRRANLMAKRQQTAALAEQATERLASRARTRLEVLAEMVKQAAMIEDPQQAAEAAQAVREMTAAFKKSERRVVRDTPLYVLRSDKHDIAKGSRAIRRQVSHDFRKGRKPDPDKGRGSVKLTAVDLIELHGRFAAPVLGIESYNAALAEAQRLGRLKHLVPMVPKGEAEAASEERKAA